MSHFHRWAWTVASLDLRALALFRIALGALITIDALVRLPDAAVFYSDRGIAPPPTPLLWLSRPSVLWVSGSPAWATTCLALTAVVGVGVAVGVWTRVMTIVAWVLVLSVHNRCGVVLFGADRALGVACMLACCLPVAARWSVDARRGTGTRPPGECDGAVLSLATAAFLLQLIVIYLFNVAHKDGDGWFLGTAVLQALHIDHHASWLGIWIREHVPWVSAPLSWTTLVIEGSVLWLLFPRDAVRTWLVGVMWVLHLSFALTMHLGLFSPVCMTLWIAVLPSTAMTRLLQLVRRAASSSSFSPSPASSLSSSSSWVAVEERVPCQAPRGVRPFTWWIAGVAACVVVALQAGVNIAALGGPEMPPMARAVARALSVNNAWRMFGDPSPRDGWWVVSGSLFSGRSVDLATDDHGPPVFSKPTLVARTYKSASWRTVMMHMARPDRGAAVREAYARFLCREWNASHDDDDRLQTVQLIFMAEPTQADFVERPPRRRDLLRKDCDIEPRRPR